MDINLPAAPLIHDELDRIIDMLAVRFPSSEHEEIALAVYHNYRRIAAGARITAHLIPLTLNATRRMLHSAGRSCSHEIDGLPGGERLDHSAALDLDGCCSGGISDDDGGASGDRDPQAVAAVPNR